MASETSFWTSNRNLLNPERNLWPLKLFLPLNGIYLASATILNLKRNLLFLERNLWKETTFWLLKEIYWATKGILWSMMLLFTISKYKSNGILWIPHIFLFRSDFFCKFWVNCNFFQKINSKNYSNYYFV